MATQRENAFCAFEDIAKTACKGAVSFRIPPSGAQVPAFSLLPTVYCQTSGFLPVESVRESGMSVGYLSFKLNYIDT